MGAYQAQNANVEVRHLRDIDDTTGQELGPFRTMAEAQAAGYDSIDPATGVVQIGVNVDGAFFPLDVVKAGIFFQKVDAARQRQQQQQQAATDTSQQGTTDQTQQQPPNGG